jgi:hypothetical protein
MRENENEVLKNLASHQIILSTVGFYNTGQVRRDSFEITPQIYATKSHDLVRGAQRVHYYR